MAATETRLDLVPYGGSVQYTGTAIKDGSTIAGLYAYYPKFDNSDKIKYFQALIAD